MKQLNSCRSGPLDSSCSARMNDAPRLTLFRFSEFSQMLRKTAEEDDVFIKAKLILTLAAVLLAAGAAVACTGVVIFFLVVPAVLLLSPLLLLLSVLSLFYHKATRLRHQQSRSVTIYNQSSSVIAEVGVWSVMSDRYKTDLLEPLG